MHLFQRAIVIIVWHFFFLGVANARSYEIGLDASRVSVLDPDYLIENWDLGVDTERLLSISSWNHLSDQKFFSPVETNGKRIILKFTLENAIDQEVFIRYPWASGLKKFEYFVFDSRNNRIDGKNIQESSRTWAYYLAKGQYRFFVIIEPKFLEETRSLIEISNAEFGYGYRRITSEIIGSVSGIALGQIIFMLIMFLLSRKIYFIYYVSYTLSALFQLTVIGNFSLMIPHVMVSYFSYSVMFWASFLLSTSILRTKTLYPVVYKVSFYLLILSTIMTALSIPASAGLLLDFQYLRTALVLGFSSFLLHAISAFRSFSKGSIPAGFYFLGWLILFVGGALTFVGVFFGSSDGILQYLHWSYALAFPLESIFFSAALIVRQRESERLVVNQNQHLLSQLEKVIYRHQLNEIKRGKELELTMPTTTSQACVLSFDIVGSSKIHHVNAKDFFRNTFTRCNEIISDGYDGESLKAAAYRIKEMGDGFLCSVGYPFAALSKNPANDSIDLAKRFARILKEEAEMLHSETPISCGMGIALDTITGFYPEAGTKEYDLYGQAIVLATRYEGLRKTLFEAEKGRSVLIIQEKVYQSLDPSHRAGFIAMDLKELGVVVRDDPAAVKLYYQFLDETASKEASLSSHLKVI